MIHPPFRSLTQRMIIALICSITIGMTLFSERSLTAQQIILPNRAIRIRPAIIVPPAANNNFVDSKDKKRKLYVWRVLDTYSKFDKRITALQFSPKGDLLAVASSDNIVKLLELKTKKIKAELKGHGNWILSIAFSPDGQKIATGCKDNKIHLWEVATGKQLGTFSGHTGSVNAVVFTKDGKKLLSASDDKRVLVWDVESQKTDRTFKMHTTRPVTGVCLNQDGKMAISIDNRGRMIGWDIASGTRHWYIYTGQSMVKKLARCSPSENKSVVVTTDSTGRYLKITDARTGKLVSSIQGQFARHGNFSVQPKGALIAISSQKNVSQLWTIKGKLIGDLTTKNNPPYPGSSYANFQFSPDGKYLAEAGRKTLQIWAIGQKSLPFDLPDSDKNRLTNIQLIQAVRELRGKVEFQSDDVKKPIIFIDMIDSNCSNENLSHLASLTSLQRLDLSRTHISDDGLIHLEKLVNLKHLFLCGCKLSKESLDKLKAKLPKTKIYQ